MPNPKKDGFGSSPNEVPCLKSESGFLKEMHEFSKESSIRSNVSKESRYFIISSRQKIFLIAFLLFVLAFLVFLPATRNPFVNYDDTVYITENPHVLTGLTVANLEWAATSSYAANWHPLTWLSHMFDCQLYGSKPWGHHLTNILLHALNTMFLFLALQQMTGATGRSLAVAALFGVHPLHVESVAWVAERKDVLSGLFFMLTLLAYTQYVRKFKVQAGGFRIFYFLALITFCLGLMSKPMLVTLPFIMLLLDWWPLNRISSFDLKRDDFTSQHPYSNLGNSIFTKLLLEKLPFFALTVMACIVTFKVQQSNAAIVETLPLVDRIENSWVSYCRYIDKFFLPSHLAVFYPHVNEWPLAIILVCAIILAVASTFVLMLSRRYPYLPVGWFWYLGMLIPVIGFVQAGTQSMADRYTYLPMIGILIMIIWGIHASCHTRQGKIVLSVIVMLITGAYGLVTVHQIRYWHDSETLFRHALAVTKTNGVALDNLARALGEKGRLDEATEQFRAALKLNPNDPFALSGMGVISMKRHDYPVAAEYFQKALNFDPENAVTHYDLGIVLANESFLDQAISQFQDAILINPDYADAYNNLGVAKTMNGHYDEAISAYRQTIHLKPDNAVAHKNLGVVLVKSGQLNEAVKEFREALRLQPDFEEAREKLKITLELKMKNGL